jgi:N-acetylgalactosamine kinase
MISTAGRLPPSRWLKALEKGLLDSRLRNNAGDDNNLLVEHKNVLDRALRGYLASFGDSKPVCILRAPGRINLLGMHVDHRGGCVNPIAIKETVVVASPNQDDLVNLANDNRDFPRRNFRVSEELPEKPVADWDDWTAKNLQSLAAQGLSGDWSNYCRAAGCYLANLLWQEKDLPPAAFKGMDAFVASNMPMAVGLSSSSTLVVTMALLFSLFNSCEIDDTAMIDHCGTAEWYVGTRGGKGDHAAIILSRQGKITQIAFFPFETRKLSFPEQYRVVVCNSLVLSRKGATTRHAFNERIASYEIGFLLLNKIAAASGLDPSSIRMLRDFCPQNLGLDDRQILELLLELPERVGRKEVDAELGAEHAELLRKLWQTHPEPEEGYPIRDVCLFGTAECLRAKLTAGILERGGIEEFGRLMNVSHDGDRVTRIQGEHRVPWQSRLTRETLSACSENELLLHLQPGGYRVSTPQIDRLVDLCLETDGVLGARLTGAGYGGCVAVLVHQDAVEPLLAKLEKGYYTPRGNSTAAEVCRPLAGANFYQAP